MNRFGRRSNETNRHEVLASLEASGLDKETTLIFGGAVLALLDIRPADDVDTMVPGAVFDDLLRSKRTPGGLYTIAKQFATSPFLEAHSTPMRHTPLPLDITRPSKDPDPRREADFLRDIARFEKVEGYPILPLDQIVADKQRSPRRRKDKRDIELIRAYQTNESRKDRQ